MWGIYHSRENAAWKRGDFLKKVVFSIWKRLPGPQVRWGGHPWFQRGSGSAPRMSLTAYKFHTLWALVCAALLVGYLAGTKTRDASSKASG